MTTTLALTLPLDAPSFADALGSHRPYLIRFASRRLRDAALVEDVVQDTLLSALRAAPRFAQRSSLRTWLTAILQRRMADAVRDARRHAAPTLAGDDPDADADADHAPAEAADWLDPPRRLADREFLDVLERSLQALPPLAARLFHLRHVDGIGNDDAAAALGLSPRRCAVLLHRACTRLRSALRAAGLAPEGAAIGPKSDRIATAAHATATRARRPRDTEPADARRVAAREPQPLFQE